MRSDLLNRGVTLGTALAPGLPRVSGDRNQLQQVLLNLLMNACDAMDAQPTERRLRVTVTRSNAPGHVEITVSDRGTGIPAAELERIFEPFVTTKAKGIGLGLFGDLPLHRCRARRPAVGHQQYTTRCHTALRTAHPA